MCLWKDKKEDFRIKENNKETRKWNDERMKTENWRRKKKERKEQEKKRKGKVLLRTLNT